MKIKEISENIVEKIEDLVCVNTDIDTYEDIMCCITLILLEKYGQNKNKNTELVEQVERI